MELKSDLVNLDEAEVILFTFLRKKSSTFEKSHNFGPTFDFCCVFLVSEVRKRYWYLCTRTPRDQFISGHFVPIR